MKKKRLISRALLAMILVVGMALSGIVPAFAEPPAGDGESTAKNYNVMLVVDASGSMTVGSDATDPDGFRFDAVDLFLGLMSNTGNYAGVTVYNRDVVLSTDVVAVTGNPSKTNLSSQVRSVPAGNATDIGKALREAGNKLQQVKSNGLPCVIVLLTDGQTNLTVDGSDPKTHSETQSALSNENAVLQDLAKANIPVYGVLLNATGKESSEEMDNITSKTGGAYEVVTKANDLQRVFSMFYSLLYETEATSENTRNFTLDDTGIHVEKKKVPAFGVAELNLKVSAGKKITFSKITEPDGTVREREEFDNLFDVTELQTLELIKIPNPAEGEWTFEVQGQPGLQCQLEMLFNPNLGLNVRAVDNKNVYMSGETIAVEGFVLDDGKVVDNPAAYNTDMVTMELASPDGEHTTAMNVSVENGHFVGTVPAPEVTGSSRTYYIQASYELEGMKVNVNKLAVAINPYSDTNTPPVAKTSASELRLRRGDTWSEFDMNSYFSDDDGDELTYNLVSSPYSADSISLSDNTLRIKSDSLTGRCTVGASDGKASTMITFDVIGNGAPVASVESEDISIELNKLFGDSETKIPLEGYFTDPDGDPLTYSIEACDYDFDKNDVITLNTSDPDDPYILVNHDGFEKSNLVLRATDSAGASSEITFHFTTFDWWLVYGGIVLGMIIVAGIVLLVAAIIIGRRRFKGYLTVQNPSSGSFGNQKGGYCSPYSIIRRPIRFAVLSGVNISGFDPKARFYPISDKVLGIKSPKPFYVDGKSTKKAKVRLEADLTITSGTDANANRLLIKTYGPKNKPKDNRSGGNDPWSKKPNPFVPQDQGSAVPTGANAPWGQPPASGNGGNPYGSNSGGSNPYGGGSPYGGNSGSGNPYGGNSGGGNPYGGNSGGGNPYGGNSGGGNPYGGNSGGGNPYGGGSPYGGNGGRSPF